MRQRVLYYYATEAAARQGQARGSIYLSSATLVIGQQDVHKREYKHYFEVPHMVTHVASKCNPNPTPNPNPFLAGAQHVRATLQAEGAESGAAQAVGAGVART